VNAHLFHFGSIDHRDLVFHQPVVDDLSYSQCIFFGAETILPFYVWNNILVNVWMSVGQNVVSPATLCLDSLQFNQYMILFPLAAALQADPYKNDDHCYHQER
jgi:hypothetical protein